MFAECPWRVVTVRDGFLLRIPRNVNTFLLMHGVEFFQRWPQRLQISRYKICQDTIIDLLEREVFTWVYVFPRFPYFIFARLSCFYTLRFYLPNFYLCAFIICIHFLYFSFFLTHSSSPLFTHRIFSITLSFRHDSYALSTFYYLLASFYLHHFFITHSCCYLSYIHYRLFIIVCRQCVQLICARCFNSRLRL